VKPFEATRIMVLYREQIPKRNHILMKILTEKVVGTIFFKKRFAFLSKTTRTDSENRIDDMF